MAKRSDRKRAVLDADKWFSRYIRARDDYTCTTCGRRGQPADGVMQCGHVVTRSKYATRWDDQNAVCQCSSCNMRHEYQPEILTLCYIQMCGSEAYERLVTRSNVTVKFATSDIREIASRYKTMAMEAEG